MLIATNNLTQEKKQITVYGISIQYCTEQKAETQKSRKKKERNTRSPLAGTSPEPSSKSKTLTPPEFGSSKKSDTGNFEEEEDDKDDADEGGGSEEIKA